VSPCQPLQDACFKGLRAGWVRKAPSYFNVFLLVKTCVRSDGWGPYFNVLLSFQRHRLWIRYDFVLSCPAVTGYAASSASAPSGAWGVRTKARKRRGGHRFDIETVRAPTRCRTGGWVDRRLRVIGRGATAGAVSQADARLGVASTGSTHHEATVCRTATGRKCGRSRSWVGQRDRHERHRRCRGGDAGSCSDGGIDVRQGVASLVANGDGADAGVAPGSRSSSCRSELQHGGGGRTRRRTFAIGTATVIVILGSGIAQRMRAPVLHSVTAVCGWAEGRLTQSDGTRPQRSVDGLPNGKRGRSAEASDRG